eukprot:scaffold846_cov168-Amphora_coffeaeformis.AAC.23
MFGRLKKKVRSYNRKVVYIGVLLVPKRCGIHGVMWNQSSCKNRTEKEQTPSPTVAECNGTIDEKQLFYSFSMTRNLETTRQFLASPCLHRLSRRQGGSYHRIVYTVSIRVWYPYHTFP